MSSGAAQIVEAAAAFRAVLAEFEPGPLHGIAWTHLAEELAATEKACAGVRLIVSVRAVADGAHTQAGFADPAVWVARHGGTTSTQARQALELARSLEAHPETKDALLSGAMSVAQAQEIARAEPELGTERDLVEMAKRGDLTNLRDELRERRLSSTPVGELHRRQRAARRFRHWRDGLGMICFDGALPPECGIPFVNRIERRAQQLHRAARRSGAVERFEAHAADAIVELAGEGGAQRGGRPMTELVVVCDVFAWRRGHRHDGEPCHVVGGGPIPVDVVKELSKDAFFKIVLHDGKDIQRVHHAGRRYTAELRTALDLGPVPAFTGRECADCGRRGYGMEYDHDDPVAHTGPTSYGNMKSRCRPCHTLKTERDREAGLLGPKAKARGPGRPSKKTAKVERSQRSRTTQESQSTRSRPPAPDPP